VRPAYKGRGKGKRGKSRDTGPQIPSGARCIEDICTHNDEELWAYCFCCPALEVNDLRQLYTPPPPESSVQGPVSTKGKSAQDIFGECIIRKNMGVGFIRSGSLELFHTSEELHTFFVQVGMVAKAHINHAPPKAADVEAWLKNMPTDEEAGWGASELNKEIHEETPDPLPTPTPPLQEALSSAVVEADRAIGGWKDARRNVTVHLPKGKVTRLTNPDSSLTVLPIRRED
jgi:hypothetical protein